MKILQDGRDFYHEGVLMWKCPEGAIADDNDVPGAQLARILFLKQFATAFRKVIKFETAILQDQG